MEANSIPVELRPGWPMHVGVVTNGASIVWKAPVARVNPVDALADAKEYLSGAPLAANDTRDIDRQLDELDALIKANRAPQCVPNASVSLTDLADTWIPWELNRSPVGPA